jgi:uncharacterized protein
MPAAAPPASRPFLIPPRPPRIRIVDAGRETDLKGSMLVVGFPTHGLVGSVAVSYLVHSLDMKPVAYMTSDSFPPTVVMEDGIVVAPVRFYASRMVCGVNGKCEQLVVALSDIQPAPELLNQIGATILDWAQRRKVSLVVAVEGQPVQDPVGSEVRVVAMANRAASAILDRYSFERASGVVTGFAGALLLSSVGRRLPVLCLVAQAHREYPDARAAARVLETINPLVPLLLINTKPLLEKAQQIETEMRRSIQQQKESLNQLATPAPASEMYR